MAKSIRCAVGFGEPNLPDDVRVIQYLLNCVPPASGGPHKELLVDGHSGAATIEAIRRFQWAIAKTPGARIAPHSSLLGTLKKFDPYPHLLLPLMETGTKYTMFSPNGTPLRATANVKLSQAHTGSFKKTA